MTTIPSPDRQPDSSAFASQRDTQILWLLERHPATAGMLSEIQLFRSKARASKRLNRLVEKKQLRLAGTVSLKDGRPEHVYCRGHGVKGDNVLHEVQISRLCFKTHADEVRRGPDGVDTELRPDAEFLINGQRYLLEFDNGTMGLREIIQTRFSKYRFCRYLVLWVCATQARMEGLRRRAEMIRATALFTTLDLALRDPHATIWVDFDGEAAALPRGGKGSPKGEEKT